MTRSGRPLPIVIPAKAGTHFSAAGAVDGGSPAFAGTTVVVPLVSRIIFRAGRRAAGSCSRDRPGSGRNRSRLLSPRRSRPAAHRASRADSFGRLNRGGGMPAPPPEQRLGAVRSGRDIGEP